MTGSMVQIPSPRCRKLHRIHIMRYGAHIKNDAITAVYQIFIFWHGLWNTSLQEHHFIKEEQRYEEEHGNLGSNGHCGPLPHRPGVRFRRRHGRRRGAWGLVRWTSERVGPVPGKQRKLEGANRSAP